MEERFKQLLAWKKSFDYMAEMLSKEYNKNITPETLKKLKRSFTEKEFQILSEDNKYDKNEKTITVQSNKPLSREEIEKKVGIDNKTSFLNRSWLKSHRDNTWTYSILITYATEESKEVDRFSEFLKTYNSKYKPLTRENLILNKDLDNDHALVVSLTDFHIDKRTVDEESIEKRKAIFRETLTTLVYRAYRSFGLDEIIFVIGNDFFHTDNFQNQTTSGTPQDVNTSWNNSYEEGFKLLVWAIEFLEQFCNKLQVIHVPCNHSKQKGFYLAHALETYFKEATSITFDRTAVHTKVYNYGTNLLGFHHGDTDINRLPIYFPSKFAVEWGLSKFRYIFLGHIHHPKKYKFVLDNREVEGIRLSYLPSLSGSDSWHDMKLYDSSIRAGVASVYHRSKGYLGEFEHKI